MKTAPFGIQITVTRGGIQSLHATLIGSTVATDLELSQMISQWLSAVQGVMTGSIKLEMKSESDSSCVGIYARSGDSGNLG